MSDALAIATGGIRTRTDSVSRIMILVLVALLPAAMVKSWDTGPELAWHLIAAACLSLVVEFLMLRWRRQAQRPFLADLSAPVAAVLLVMMLPATAPWWMVYLGTVISMIVGKHAYGGLGDNPFNPAAVGAALLFCLFPARLVEVLPAHPGSLAMAYALGGSLLLWRGVISWHAPAGMCVGVTAGIFAFGMPMAAVFSPETMFALAPAVALAALFVVTDPVTGCIGRAGRLVAGAGVGLVVMFLGQGRSVQAAIPFAVLLMNCVAPWLDDQALPSRWRTAARG